MRSKIKRLFVIVLCIATLTSVMSGTALATKATKKTKKINIAYSKILSKSKYNNYSYNQYSFFDLTGDSTKELIITHGESEGGKLHDVYTYKKGKAKKIGSFEAWHSALGYKKKQLYQYQWHWSGATIHSVKYKNGKFKRKEVFYFSEETDPNTTLEKKLKKKGYNKIKYLKTCYVGDDSLLYDVFPR